MNLRNRLGKGAVVAATLVLGVVGVRGAEPRALPSTTDFAHGWTLTVQFANALNLPDQAHVRLNGRTVGVLRSVALSGGHTDAHLVITEPARIPADARAELRQDTLLGDVYVLITAAPGDPAPALTDGAVIPLSRTAPPEQIEDLMTSLSGFLGSGGVAQLGNTVNRVNAAFPADPAATRKITANLTDTVTAWADDTANLDSALRSVVGITDKLVAERRNLSAYLSPAGLRRWGTIAETGRVAEVFAALAPVLHNAAPLTPGLRRVSALFTQVVGPLLLLDRPVGATRPDNLLNLRDLFRDTIIPWVEKGPEIDVVRVGDTADPGPAVPTAEKADRVLKTLRMMGAVR